MRDRCRSRALKHSDNNLHLHLLPVLSREWFVNKSLSGAYDIVKSTCVFMTAKAKQLEEMEQKKIMDNLAEIKKLSISPKPADRTRMKALMATVGFTPIDNNPQSANQQPRFGQNGSNSNFSPPNSPNSQNPRPPFNNNASNFPPARTLTEDERKRSFNKFINGSVAYSYQTHSPLCFKCGSVGYRADACPSTDRLSKEEATYCRQLAWPAQYSTQPTFSAHWVHICQVFDAEDTRMAITLPTPEISPTPQPKKKKQRREDPGESSTYAASCASINILDYASSGETDNSDDEKTDTESAPNLYNTTTQGPAIYMDALAVRVAALMADKRERVEDQNYQPGQLSKKPRHENGNEEILRRKPGRPMKVQFAPTVEDAPDVDDFITHPASKPEAIPPFPNTPTPTFNMSANQIQPPISTPPTPSSPTTTSKSPNFPILTRAIPPVLPTAIPTAAPPKQIKKKRKSKTLQPIKGRAGKEAFDYNQLAENIKVEISLSELFAISPEFAKNMQLSYTQPGAR